MPQINDTFAEFKERQACECVHVNGRWVFANGARSDGQYLFLPPPTNEIELMQLRHEFLKGILEAKIARYQRDYQNIHDSIYFESIGAGPGPIQGWEKHLEKLNSEIEALQTEFNSLTERLPQVQRLRVLEAEREQRHSIGREKMQKLKSLRTY